MVPWCGRIRDGRFLDGAVVRQMPLNAPPHAIHGTARDGAWRTARTSTAEAVLTHELVDPWPHPGRVTQVVALAEDALTLTMSVETYESSFPAQIGWHPWFNRNLGGEDVRIDFDPAWQEERGDDHLPTGNRVEPKPGPWDDCFGMPGGVDVTLTWPGQLELKVARAGVGRRLRRAGGGRVRGAADRPAQRAQQHAAPGHAPGAAGGHHDLELAPPLSWAA
ncbi:hypothetical protein SVIOM74S_09052 [Streptomyces violarus]